MKVKPAIPGAIVRDPHSQLPLPPEGAEVPESNYWVRRLRSGDVVMVGGDPAAPPTTARQVASAKFDPSLFDDRDTPRPGADPVAPLTTRSKP